jgi:hypothetical protein
VCALSVLHNETILNTPPNQVKMRLCLFGSVSRSHLLKAPSRINQSSPAIHCWSSLFLTAILPGYIVIFYPNYHTLRDGMCQHGRHYCTGSYFHARRRSASTVHCTLWILYGRSTTLRPPTVPLVSHTYRYRSQESSFTLTPAWFLIYYYST